MTTENNELARRDQEKVIESLVLRGDVSALGPAERARYYVRTCEQLGLNPTALPFAFLRLNGKEILYATRGCTDQLAAIHRINRDLIEGPKVLVLEGEKLVYAVCRATHPNGRTEVSTASVPLPKGAEAIANALMKTETKAKRRATLAILGLANLDESELDTIPVHAREPGGGVDLSLAQEERLADANQMHAVPLAYAEVARAQGDDEGPDAAEPPSEGDLAAMLGELAAAPTIAALEDLWRRQKPVRVCMTADQAKRVGEAFAARKRALTQLPPDGTDPKAQRLGAARAALASAGGTVVATGTTSGPTSLARSLAAHLAAKPRARPGDPRAKTRELAEVAHSYLKRRAEYVAAGCADEALDVVRAELLARGCTDPDALLQGVAEHVGHRTTNANPTPRKQAA